MLRQLVRLGGHPVRLVVQKAEQHAGQQRQAHAREQRSRRAHVAHLVADAEAPIRLRLRVDPDGRLPDLAPLPLEQRAATTLLLLLLLLMMRWRGGAHRDGQR